MATLPARARLPLAAVTLLLLGTSAWAQPSPTGSEDRHKWWLSDSVRAEVGLSDQQSRDIEAIFQAVLPRLRTGKEELDRLEAEVSQLLTEGTADESQVAAAIDRVEAARTAVNKNRTLMLFRMYRVLSPEQRVKLRAIHERYERGRRDRREPGSREH